MTLAATSRLPDVRRPSEPGREFRRDQNTRSRSFQLVLVGDPFTELANLEHYLVQLGYQVTSDTDRDAILVGTNGRDADLLVLSALKDESEAVGVTSCLRTAGVVAPIIALIRSKEARSRVALLNAGADDVVSKPFSPVEIACRVEAILRRSARRTSSATTLRFSDIRVDLRNHTADRNGHPIDISPNELRLLSYLMRNPHRALTRVAIAEDVWGDAVHAVKNVAPGISVLRKKLNRLGPPAIFTVRGIGYSMGRCRHGKAMLTEQRVEIAQSTTFENSAINGAIPSPEGLSGAGRAGTANLLPARGGIDTGRVAVGLR